MKQRVQSGRWSWETVTEFYGVKRRFYFETEAIGRQMGKAPPWEMPAELGDWFDSSQEQGLRKKAPPASLMERVTAARLGEKMTLPKPTAKPSRKKAAPARSVKPPAEEPVEREAEDADFDFDDDGGGGSDAVESLAYLRAESRRLQQSIAKHRRNGNDGAARADAAKLKDVLSQQRQWEVSAARIRQGDYDAQRALTGQMAIFAGELWELLKRLFLRDCPAEEEKTRRAVLNKVAESLPGLMESHFMGAATGDQTKEAA